MADPGSPSSSATATATFADPDSPTFVAKADAVSGQEANNASGSIASPAAPDADAAAPALAQVQAEATEEVAVAAATLATSADNEEGALAAAACGEEARGEAPEGAVAAVIAQVQKFHGEDAEPGGASAAVAVAEQLFSAAPFRAFVAGREAQLRAALRLQAQYAQERKNRRNKEKQQQYRGGEGSETTRTVMLEATDLAAAESGAGDSGTAQAPADSPGDEKAREVSQPSAAPGRQIGSFKTYEEALQFVMRCQPFDFVPVLSGSECFPRFEHKKEAMAHALTLNPQPLFFGSLVGDVRRYMRITVEEVAEAAADGSSTARRSRKSVGSLRARRTSMAASAAQQAAEQKRSFNYVVEVQGEMFERPASLRDLQEKNSRYYIAVTPEVHARVLLEGFRVKRRTSIPCSATPQEAIAHFKQQQADKSGINRHMDHMVPMLLSVNLPPFIDVVPHRAGGFLIRATELPASAFKERRRQDP